MRDWWLIVAGVLLAVAGGWIAHAVQTAGGVSVADIRFDIGDGEMQSALLYRPPGASAAEPAPAILATHGYINSRETQSGFAIEYARRGFVVLAIDQTGHGFSDGAAFSKGFGGPTGLAYLRSLDFVDPDRIGLEGHSMGGWASLAAAAAMPADYAALALVGSSTGPPFAAPGTPQWPRNLAVIFSDYDEFAPLMWDVPRAGAVRESAKLQALFGSDAPVEEGRVYGSRVDGSARLLATPAVTHPGDHVSHAAIADAVQWMDGTIGAPNRLAAGDQIWLWKEAATLVALVGAMLLLLGTLGIAAARLLPGAQGAAYRLAPRGSVPGSMSGSAGTLALAALVPALTFYPLTLLGGLVADVALLPQNVTNQVAAWALGNAVLAWFATRREGWRETGGGRTVAIALLSVAAAYLAVALSGLAFVSDMRFWVVALKPLAGHHWPAFLVYLPVFTVFFYLGQRLLLTRVARGYGRALIAGVGGLVVLLAVAYGWLFATTALPPLFDPLFTIVALQFVPVLGMTSVVAVFAWRRTGRIWPGALTSALLVTWYVVAGQATHVV